MRGKPQVIIDPVGTVGDNLLDELARLDIVAMHIEDNPDPARRALLTALVPFAEERDCQVIASGVETAAERDALRSCGVRLGQGYFLGLPAPAARGARRPAVTV